MTAYADIFSLAESGTIAIDLADNKTVLTVAEAKALIALGVSFASTDEIRIEDAASTIEALGSAEIAALTTLGTSQVLATDRGLVFDLKQIEAFAGGNIATYTLYATQHAATSTDMPVGLAVSGVRAGEVMVSLNDGSYVVAHRTEINQADSYISSQKFDASGNPVGNSTIIGEETLYTEAQLAVTSLADGGYVLAWTHRQRAIYTQRYDADGVAVGEPTEITTALGNMAPSVIGLSDGGYMVTTYQSTNDGGALLSFRYDASGALLGQTTNSPYVVGSAYSEGGQLTQMVELADGKVIVIWPGSDGSGGGVMAQIIDSAGVNSGASFVINTQTQWFQGQQSVTALADGGFVVVWLNAAQDYTISMQRFDDAGGKVGSEVAVNSSSYTQSGQQVTALADGGFVVTWAWEGQDSPSPASGEAGGVYAQLFDADGNRIGPLTLVNTTVVGGQDMPKIVALKDGGYAIVWQESVAANGDGIEINAQVFDADGNKVGGELAVNVSESGNQSAQTVIALADGGFAITWYDDITRKYLTRAFHNDTEKAVASDTAAEASSLTTAGVAALAKIGIDEINISDGGHVTLAKAVAAALINVSGLEIVAAGSVTIAGTGAALDDFSVADIASLKALGITGLDASDNAARLSYDQAVAYVSAGLAFASGDAITVTLSAAQLGSLASSDLGSLVALGVQVFDLGENAISLSLSQISTFKTYGLRFAASDVITLADTQVDVSDLSVSEIAALGVFGVARIDLTDDASTSPATLTLAQAQAYLAAGISFAASNSVYVSDSVAHIAALGAADIAALAAIGIDKVQAGGTLAITVAQFEAYLDNVVVIDAGIEHVQLSDTGANFAELASGRIAHLADFNIRTLNASDDRVVLTIDQIEAYASAGASFASGDTVALSVMTSTLAVLSADSLSAAASFGVTGITAAATVDATLAALALVQAAGLHFETGFVARLSDTAAHLLAAAPADIAAYTALGVDAIRLVDGAGKIAALSVSDIGTLDANGVQTIVVTDETVTIGLANAYTLAEAGIVFAAADTVTVSGTSATFAEPGSLDLSSLQSIHVDKIDVTDDALTLSLDQANAYLAVGIGFSGADAITVKLTLSEARALSATSGAALIAAGVDRLEIDATPEEIKALTVAQIAALGSAGIDAVDLEPDSVVLSADQIAAFRNAGIAFAGDDTVSEHAAPTLVGDTATAREGATAKVDVLANDAAHDGLSLSIQGAAITSGHAAVTVNSDGTLSVTYTGADLTAKQSAAVTVHYTASDGLLTAGADLVVTFSGVDARPATIIGTAKADKLVGTAAGETIKGLAGADVLLGKGGNDVIQGGAGADRITGGLGFDDLYGGSGKDRFVFTSVKELGVSKSSTDEIFDFSHKQHDIIDFETIDANTRRGGDQDFTFIGTNAFHKVAGELRLAGNASGYYVYGDVDGDGKADFVLEVHSATRLVQGDFAL